MGEKVEQIKKAVAKAFPKLNADEKFEVTSKATSNYNCIAWAYGYNDRWMWPVPGGSALLDGIYCYWPENGIMEPSIDNFIEAFRLKGYELCDDWGFEEQYQKIALYAKPESWDICTHASRQLRNGCWTSKLGHECDIQHGTPYSIENDSYGNVRCIMRRPFK